MQPEESDGEGDEDEWVEDDDDRLAVEVEVPQVDVSSDDEDPDSEDDEPDALLAKYSFQVDFFDGVLGKRGGRQGLEDHPDLKLCFMPGEDRAAFHDRLDRYAARPSLFVEEGREIELLHEEPEADEEVLVATPQTTRSPIVEAIYQQFLETEAELVALIEEVRKRFVCWPRVVTVALAPVVRALPSPPPIESVAANAIPAPPRLSRAAKTLHQALLQRKLTPRGFIDGPVRYAQGVLGSDREAAERALLELVSNGILRADRRLADRPDWRMLSFSEVGTRVA